MSAAMSMADAAYEHAAALGFGVHRSRHHAMWWLGALDRLGRNLAVAGAMRAAFRHGYQAGVHDATKAPGDDSQLWFPNINGKAAT